MGDTATTSIFIFLWIEMFCIWLIFNLLDWKAFLKLKKRVWNLERKLKEIEKC